MLQTLMMDTIQAAQMATEAWRKGESAGTYTDFRKLLSVHFDHFTHPIAGIFEGEKAKNELEKLMTDQESLINELSFSQIEFFKNGHAALAMLDARGTLMGGRYYYDGGIVLSFRFDDHGKIRSFRIFIGRIDERWFASGGKMST